MLNRHRKLRMEQMEARQMMAGDVAAFVSNGNLFLNEFAGQAGLDNAVMISQIVPGTIRVHGVSPSAGGSASKINGATFKDFKVTGGLVVNFGGGNDSVTFTDIAPSSFKNVDLNLAAPPPVVSKGATSVKNAKSGITAALPLNLPDKDRVTISGATISGWLTINTGADDDSVNVANTTVGHSVSGDLTNPFGVGGITINTGAGNDFIHLENLASNHDVIFDAGTGEDRAEVINVAVLDNFMAELGDGSDIMSVDGLYTGFQTSADKTRISGGNGIDSLTTTGQFPTWNREITGWEYINGFRVGLPEVFMPGGGVLERV